MLLIEEFIYNKSKLAQLALAVGLTLTVAGLLLLTEHVFAQDDEQKSIERGKKLLEESAKKIANYYEKQKPSYLLDPDYEIDELGDSHVSLDDINEVCAGNKEDRKQCDRLYKAYDDQHTSYDEQAAQQAIEEEKTAREDAFCDNVDEGSKEDKICEDISEGKDRSSIVNDEIKKQAEELGDDKPREGNAALKYELDDEEEIPLIGEIDFEDEIKEQEKELAESEEEEPEEKEEEDEEEPEEEEEEDDKNRKF